MGHQTFTAELAATVRRELTDRHISVRELARLTGIANVTLNRRLTGTSPFTSDELAIIAEVFGMQPSALAADSEQDDARHRQRGDPPSPPGRAA